MENVNIEQFIAEIIEVKLNFKNGSSLKGVIENKAHKSGLNIFYYSGSNAINTLGGGVNLFLNDSQTNDEVLTNLLAALKLFCKQKERSKSVNGFVSKTR